MFSFSLALILIPYAVFVMVFLVFALINVYHLIHYGQTTRVSFAVTFVFFLVTGLIFFLSFAAIRDTDWRYPIDFTFPAFGTGQSPSL